MVKRSREKTLKQLIRLCQNTNGDHVGDGDIGGDDDNGDDGGGDDGGGDDGGGELHSPAP